MVVGICELDIHLGSGRSLKAKRKIVRRVIDRTRERFNVSVAEVGDNDVWQRARIGLGAVGNDERHIVSTLDTVIAFVATLIVPGEILGRVVDIVQPGEGAWKPAAAWPPDAGGDFENEWGVEDSEDIEGDNDEAQGETHEPEDDRD